MLEPEVPDDTPEESSKLEIQQGDVYSKYLLYSRSEIIFVLRAVLQKGSMLTVYFDQGRSFLLTSLLEVDSNNGQLLFDVGSNPEMNRKAEKAESFLFTTALDKVKVQFSLKHLEPVQHAGRPAFRGTIPETLLRLQRREYYRLATPVANPLRCELRLQGPDGGAAPADPPLLDISGGGVGLMLDTAMAASFPVGTTFADCKITLPDEGALVCTLIVRNAFEVTTKSGNRYLRVGCEFVDLPGPRLTMVQRYITRVERERKARMSGMG